MIYFIIFLAFTISFVVSFIHEKRAFKNAVFIGFGIVFLLLSIAEFGYGTPVNTVVLFILYCAFPAIMFAISCFFIVAGILEIKREGFAIPHCLSILFGLIIISIGVISYVFLIDKIHLTWVNCLLTFFIFFGAYILFTFVALLVYSWLYTIIPKNCDCDFIIIHGAGLLDGNRVSPLLKKRIDKAVEIYNMTGNKAKLITSGGRGTDEKVSESRAMTDYLLKCGIPKESILMEENSKTTYENLLYSKEIINSINPNAKTIFVTNDYHIFRTGTYARKVGLKADGVGCKTALYYLPGAFVREYIAVMVKYKIVPIVIFILWAMLSAFSLINI